MHFSKEHLKGTGLSASMLYEDSKTGNNSEHFNNSPLHTRESHSIRRDCQVVPFFFMIVDKHKNFINLLNNWTTKYN